MNVLHALRQPVRTTLTTLITLAAFFSATVGWADTLYFVHTDHLGTPRVITDSSQQSVWEGSQQPFGEATTTTNAIEFNVRFPGQYYDQESGLHYNYFRDYDPSLGRYVQSDPIGINGTDYSPQRIVAANLGLPFRTNPATPNHLYSYVDQNPLRFSDATGEGSLVYVFVGVVCGIGIWASVETGEDGMQQLVGIRKEQIDSAQKGEQCDNCDSEIQQAISRLKAALGFGSLAQSAPVKGVPGSPGSAVVNIVDKTVVKPVSKSGNEDE